MYQTPNHKLSELFTAVKRQFGDESGVQLMDSDIIRWINDAQSEINRRNNVLKDTATLTATTGQADYSFPAGPDVQIQQVEALHYNGIRISNVPFAEAEAKIIGLSQPEDARGPQIWYEWGGTFTFYPAPVDDGTIKLFYTRMPVVVTPATPQTDPIGLPDEYFPDIVNWIMKQSYEMDEDWTAAQAKAGEFENSVNARAESSRVAENMTFQVINIVD